MWAIHRESPTAALAKAHRISGTVSPPAKSRVPRLVWFFLGLGMQFQGDVEANLSVERKLVFQVWKDVEVWLPQKKKKNGSSAFGLDEINNDEIKKNNTKVPEQGPVGRDVVLFGSLAWICPLESAPLQIRPTRPGPPKEPPAEEQAMEVETYSQTRVTKPVSTEWRKYLVNK